MAAFNNVEGEEEVPQTFSNPVTGNIKRKRTYAPGPGGKRKSRKQRKQRRKSRKQRRKSRKSRR